MDLAERLAAFQRFCGPNLARTISDAEAAIHGAKSDTLATVLADLQATEEAIAGANELKRLAGQVNVVIHTLGILRCLPHLLEPGETVQYASLGAGTGGRPFDLETDRRVAEFKFIQWRGGPETIRQNALFKDFFSLVEHPTSKRKYLYLLETDRPLRFLNGRRALESVLKDTRLAAALRAKYGNQYQTVREYFHAAKETLTIQDVSNWLPMLAGIASDTDSPVA